MTEQDQCERCGRRHRTLTSCVGSEEYREKRRAYHKTPEAKARRRRLAANPTPTQVARKLRSAAAVSGYEITAEERDERLDEQGHCCAVCRRPFRAPTWHLNCTFSGKLVGRRIPRVLVDHDHDTGLVRGLLCNWCNRNIMPLFDNHREVMTRASQYGLQGGWSTE
jgi:hypothetical protein